MSEIPLPDYYNARLVNAGEVIEGSDQELMTGYLIVNVEFEFPPNVKYPYIPCYVDKTTTTYHLKGSAFLTGPELLLAKK
jgi:hypothetical protein